MDYLHDHGLGAAIPPSLIAATVFISIIGNGEPLPKFNKFTFQSLAHTNLDTQSQIYT